MGWYDELKESDLFRASKDLADGVGKFYEQNKMQETESNQAKALNVVEVEQNQDARLISPLEGVAKSGYSYSKVAVYGVGAVALLALAVVAVRG